MMIYITIGQIDYEGIDILGVFTDRSEALQRCRDVNAKIPGLERPHYHRYWIHTWKLGAVEGSDTHMVSPAEMAYKHA